MAMNASVDTGFITPSIARPGDLGLDKNVSSSSGLEPHGDTADFEDSLEALRGPLDENKRKNERGSEESDAGKTPILNSHAEAPMVQKRGSIKKPGQLSSGTKGNGVAGKAAVPGRGWRGIIEKTDAGTCLPCLL